GGLTKDGLGTMRLSGVNTYTDLTTVSAGTLQLARGSAIIDSGLVSVGGSGTLELLASETVAAIDGATGAQLLLNNFPLTAGDAANHTFDGPISGPGGALTKTGTGTLLLSGTNSYTGTTTVSAGKLQVHGGDAIADTGLVEVSGSAIFELLDDET